jgi:hippurate hydrolase
MSEEKKLFEKMNEPLPEVAAVLDRMIALRHDIHAHPELGFEEHRTAALAAKALREMGCDSVTEGVGRTGVVAVIRGKPGRHAVALRADMDALPLVEKTGVAYASQTPGRMHACGHDGHVAWALTAAAALCRTRRFKGNAVIIIQPGEEGYAGAREMIRDGLFTRWQIDEVYGAHGGTELPLGKFGFTVGPCNAAAAKFTITVTGKGGHGSRPHRCIDPVVASAELVLALQTVVSRSVDPMHPAVVAVGSIHGGDPVGQSVVPESVRLDGTTRCAYAEDEDTIERRMGEICEGLSKSTLCRIALDYTRMYAPLVNPPEQTAFVRRIAEAYAGKENCVDREPSMGAEDFSFYLKEKPGAFFRVGMGDAEHSAYAHSPGFNFNDKAIAGAASIFVRLVEERLAYLDARD